MHLHAAVLVIVAICLYGFVQQAVPSDLDSLFGQWPRVHNGNSLVGGKDRLSYGIDPDTGEVCFHAGHAVFLLCASSKLSSFHYVLTSFHYVLTP